jgi:hypothetical protein
VTGLPLARWRPGPCSVIIVETALGLPGLPKISPEATAPPFVRCLFTCADFVSVVVRTAAAGPVLVFFERARVVFHLPQRAAVGSPGLSRIAPPPPEWLGFCVAVFVFPCVFSHSRAAARSWVHSRRRRRFSFAFSTALGLCGTGSS